MSSHGCQAGTSHSDSLAPLKGPTESFTSGSQGRTQSNSWTLPRVICMLRLIPLGPLLCHKHFHSFIVSRPRGLSLRGAQRWKPRLSAFHRLPVQRGQEAEEPPTQVHTAQRYPRARPPAAPTSTTATLGGGLRTRPRLCRPCQDAHAGLRRSSDPFSTHCQGDFSKVSFPPSPPQEGRYSPPIPSQRRLIRLLHTAAFLPFLV